MTVKSKPRARNTSNIEVREGERFNYPGNQMHFRVLKGRVVIVGGPFFSAIKTTFETKDLIEQLNKLGLPPFRCSPTGQRLRRTTWTPEERRAVKEEVLRGHGHSISESISALRKGVCSSRSRESIRNALVREINKAHHELLYKGQSL